MANRAHLDFETRSAKDLRKSGVFPYAEHPSTGVWVMCWRIEDENRAIVAQGRWHPGDPDPQPLLDHVAAGGWVVAHNANFDRTIWNRVVRNRICRHWPSWSIRQTDCTVARAAVLNIPQQLEFVAPALGVEQRKDKAGVALMRKMMVPKTTTPCPYCAAQGCVECDDVGYTWTWNDDPKDLERLGDYCWRDVEVESEIDSVLPPLSERERKVWELDQGTNELGIEFDIRLIERAKAIVDYAKIQLNARLDALTNGAVPKASQAAALVTWFREVKRIPCESVRKGEQDELIFYGEVFDDPEVVEAIEIRRAASKTSTAKLWAATDCVSSDNRARGLLHYHGASTGRWAGRLIQPQNLYRVDEERDGRDIDLAFDILERNIPPHEAHDLLQMIVDEPMVAIAKCMRRFIVAKQGRRFVGGDLSNIEGCVNVWLAGEEWKTQAYRDYQAGQGPDLYRVAYSRSFNIPTADVNSQQRQLGKVMELALGYGGSVGAFYTMSQTYLMKLDKLLPIIRGASTAATWDKALWLYDITPAMRRHGLDRDLWAGLKIIVDNWRTAHPATCQSWWDMQDAAIAAVDSPNEVVSCCDGKIKYVSARSFLWCQLPSGRLLAYCRPRLVTKDDSLLILQDGTRVEADEYTDVEINALVKLPGVDYKKRIRQQVLYEGYIGDKKKWGLHALYGGLQDENNVSGIARDILVGGMFRAEAAGYPIVLTVHDELLAEPQIGHGSPEALRALMVEGESWAEGLPLAAKTWEGFRYEK